MRARITVGMIVAVAGLMLPVVPASAGGGSCMGGVPFTDARTTTVEMKQACFGPTVARIAPGDAVTFRNTDTQTHAVSGANGTFGDAHSEILPGDQVSFTFDGEGVYPYVCIIHPGMAGAIVVGDGAGKVSSAAGIASASLNDQSKIKKTDPTSASSGDGTPVVPIALAAALVVLSVGALIRFRTRPTAPPVPGAATPRR